MAKKKATGNANKIATVVNELLEMWRRDAQEDTGGPDVSMIASREKTMEAVSRMLEIGLGGLSPQRLSVLGVINAITALERVVHLPSPKGILTNRLVGQLFNLGNLGGDDDSHDPDFEPTPLTSPVNTNVANFDAFYIRYFVELGTFQPRYGGEKTAILIDTAWTAWTKRTKFLVVRRRTALSSDVNVVIRRADIPGSAVGLAPKAGPGLFSGPLEVKIEARSDWSSDLFFNIACHEFGHVLGLDHSPVPGVLMHDIVPPSPRGPFEEDVERIRRIYGP